MIIDTVTSGRTVIAIEDRDVPTMANVLENSSSVASYYVEGLNVKNQQAMYGVTGYTKWSSVISH